MACDLRTKMLMMVVMMGTITENDDAASDVLMVLLSSFLDSSFLDSQDPEPQASDITTLSLQLLLTCIVAASCSFMCVMTALPQYVSKS